MKQQDEVFIRPAQSQSLLNQGYISILKKGVKKMEKILVAIPFKSGIHFNNFKCQRKAGKGEKKCRNPF